MAEKILSKAEILEVLSKDVIAFGRAVSPNMYSVPSPKFHYELAELYHDKTKKKFNIQAPRGSAKSSIIGCIFPLHHIFFDEGNKFVVLSSKSLGHAQKLLSTIKDILNFSMPFRALFGYYGMQSPNILKWTENELAFRIIRNGKPENVMITTRSTSQQIVGLKHINQRPTFFILDDPEDDNNTKTSESMENNFNILLKGVIPALDPQIGRLWVVGTPQNGRCMVVRLTEFDTFVNKHYKSIINFETKEVLWKEWTTYETLMEEYRDYDRNGKLSVWFSERQCEIKGDKDQLFKPEMFQYWDGAINTEKQTLTIKKINREAVEEKTIPVNFFMGIDPASSTRATADYTAIVLIAYDAEKNIYILPYFRDRVPPAVVRDKIVEFAERFNPRKSGIETTGYQEMLKNGVKEKLLEKGIHISGFNRDEGFKPRNEKNNRLEELHIFFYDRKIYFMENACRELEDELLLFPRAKNDDLCDALYFATRKLISPDHNIEHYDRPMEEDELKYFIFNRPSKKAWRI